MLLVMVVVVEVVGGEVVLRMAAGGWIRCAECPGRQQSHREKQR
jgi:hypothetical protein